MPASTTVRLNGAFWTMELSSLEENDTAGFGYIHLIVEYIYCRDFVRWKKFNESSTLMHTNAPLIGVYVFFFCHNKAGLFLKIKNWHNVYVVTLAAT